MPSTLRRSRRRELVLTRSFTRAIQDKVRLDPDRKEGRAPFADRTNVHTNHVLVSAFDASTVPVSISFPSMIHSLYHSLYPHQPVHPIHRLPPELLVHICALGSAEDVMFPILVSHVCHSWRAIVLHAQSLWQRVLLNPASNLHMWKERILRARLCMLDVALAPYPRSRALYDIDLVALQMHLLAPYFSVLRSLDIHFNSYAPYLWNSALGPLCKSTSYLWGHRSPNPGNRSPNIAAEAPMLESLMLRYPENDDFKEFTLFGGSAPKLTRVTLEGVRLTWLPGLFGNLSFLDYTHHGFSCEKEAVNEILSMLQVSSRIQELKLCICCKATTFQPLRLRSPQIGDEDVTLPFLQSLTLRIDKEDPDISSELVAIVSRLSIPELKNLYLRDSSPTALGLPNGHSIPFASLPMFIDATCNNNTPLCNLMAEGRWAEPSLLSNLVIHMSSLQSIQVDNIIVPMRVSEM